MNYLVKQSAFLPSTSATWEHESWSPADTLHIANFHPRSSSHRPRSEVRLLHNGNALAVIFRIEDRFVLARHTAYQAPTHEDSCVEFFVQPRPGLGYFNFEFNAVGTLLLWYIDRPRRPDGSFEHYVPISPELARVIASSSSLAEPIRDEISSPLAWTLSFRTPTAFFESFVGPLAGLSRTTWRANFYKCADQSSHPHWGAWAPIGERLDFHQPERFGRIIF